MADWDEVLADMELRRQGSVMARPQKPEWRQNASPLLQTVLDMVDTLVGGDPLGLGSGPMQKAVTFSRFALPPADAKKRGLDVLKRMWENKKATMENPEWQAFQKRLGGEEKTPLMEEVLDSVMRGFGRGTLRTSKGRVPSAVNAGDLSTTGDAKLRRGIAGMRAMLSDLLPRERRPMSMEDFTGLVQYLDRNNMFGKMGAERYAHLGGIPHAIPPEGAPIVDAASKSIGRAPISPDITMDLSMLERLYRFIDDTVK